MIDRAEIARAKRCGRHSWQEIGDYFGISWQKARGLYRRAGEVEPGPCPICGKREGDRERASWEEHGNEAEGSVISDGPLSLPEFLELLRVDTDTWETADWGGKRWPVGAKIKTGDLEWQDGRITGDLHYRGLGKEDLWSTWARFRRRVPIAIKPVIQPVECEIVPVEFSHPEDSGELRRALLGADLHLGYSRDMQTGKLEPYHDRKAIALFLQVAEYLQPDDIEILGDLLDFPMWTDKYSRAPEFYWTTQPAILEAFWILSQLRRACRHASIELFMGNHEERIKKSLVNHLIEAYSLKPADEMELPPALSPQRLLALHRLGIRWVGEEEEGTSNLGGLVLSHGDIARAPAGATARAQLEHGRTSRAYGHVHRIEMASERVRDDYGWRTVRAFSVPCLCRIDGTVPGSRSAQNWQNGFAVVDYCPWGLGLTEQLIEIIGGRALFDRQEWTGQDYTDQLRAAWPDWNW